MTPPPIPAKRLREIALGLMEGEPLSFRRTSDLMRLADWMEQQQAETQQPENVQAGID